ncbi:putative exported hydrolase [Escherichia coli]|uniref:Putative exported hydrolase n=1 Tax=Escherichia coli TaxID=562 RepID=A0A376VHG2_ECOLX|nr:putative exported hydrolase [Escherichia coli]
MLQSKPGRVLLLLISPKKQIKRKARQPPKRPRKPARKTAKKAASKSTIKSKTASSVKKSSITASKNAKTRSKHAVNKTASASFTEKCTKRKGYKSHCVKVKNAASGTLADAHKAKVQKATKVAMNKLMQQIGKPYRWGGSSPRTGFDCSGLVYYAYKDLVKIRIPRTANEMYHLRDAAPIERSELKNGDLVFFPYSGTRYSRSCRRVCRQRQIYSVTAHGSGNSNHFSQ